MKNTIAFSPKTEAVVNNIITTVFDGMANQETKFTALLDRLRVESEANLNAHYNTSTCSVVIDCPRVVVNPEVTIAAVVPAASAPIHLTFTLEKIFSQLKPVEWHFPSCPAEEASRKITELLRDACSYAFSNAYEMIEHVTKGASAELNLSFVTFLQRDGLWVVYALHQDEVALLGSWAVEDFAPRFQFDKVAPNPANELLLKVKSIDGMHVKDGESIQRTAEDIYDAVRGYLRTLHSFYSATSPFNFKTIWVTQTALLLPEVGEVVGRTHVAEYMDTVAVIERLRQAATFGIDGQRPLSADRIDRLNKLITNIEMVATHLAVEVSSANGLFETYRVMCPIDSLKKVSTMATFNTNNPERTFWVPAQFKASKVEAPADDNERFLAMIKEKATSLNAFTQPPHTAQAFKTTVNALWSMIVTQHGKPGRTHHLPQRAIHALLKDFAAWLETYGHQYVLKADCFTTTTYLGEFVVEYVLREVPTGRTEALLFTYSDLTHFVAAGLDWHPDADTFFIPHQG